jgi:hypothetical protein
MVDMSQFIAAKSDQLNADDLMDAPRTITVTKVTAAPDAAEQPVSIHYEGDAGKPFKPCKTMRRILVGVWGKDASKYVGRSMTLYRDATVAFGGLQVGGIRISHMSDIAQDKTVALLVTRGRRAPFKIKPLVKAPTSSQPSDFSGQLAELKALATPGNMDALATKWQDIGAEARKALAAELPALKAACQVSAEDPLEGTLKRISDAFDEREVDAIDKETESDRTFMTAEQVERLDEAFAAKRAALREKVGAE